MTVTGHTPRTDGARFTRRAWWSLLGFVPSFVLAFVVGEGLISALGYPSGGDPRARVPMTLALVVAAGFVLLNGLSALAILLS